MVQKYISNQNSTLHMHNVIHFKFREIYILLRQSIHFPLLRSFDWKIRIVSQSENRDQITFIVRFKA